MTVKQKNAVSGATAELPYDDAPYAEGLANEDLLQNPRLLTEVLPVAESALWGGWDEPGHSTIRSDEDHLPVQEALLAFQAAGHDAVYVDAAQSDEDDEGGILLQDHFLPFLGWLAFSSAGGHAAGPTSYEVSGRILLGPITDASGLSVGIFRADGVALNGKGVVFSEGGRYSIEVQDPYAGVVVLRVVDATTGADFLDEAERKVLDMTQDYRALGVVDGVNNVVIDINAMTEMVAVFLGLTSGDEGGSSVDVLDKLPADIDLTQVDLATVVDETVSKVEAWFGLTAGDLSKPAEAVILDNEAPNPEVNLTGQFLAVVSGLTATTGESSQAVIERLVADLRNETWSDDLVRDVVVAAERAGAVALDVGTALGWMPEQVEQVTTSWRVIETAAASPEAPRPTETDYKNLGVHFSVHPVPPDALASLVGSALTARTLPPPDSVAELRDLVDSSARLYGTITGDTAVATVTVADLSQVGIDNVTQEQLPTVVELLTQGVPTDQPVPAVQELAKQIAVAIALYDLNPLTNTVRENAAGDTPVGITAKASGISDGRSVTYRLNDDAGGLFKIDASSGLVTTTSIPIDRELGGATRTIGVTATSTDTSSVTQTSQQTFVVAIVDQNEFAVSALGDTNAEADAVTKEGVVLHGLVWENASENTRVGITARATDADASSVIRYSLSQNEGGFFKIDETTGVVSTTNVLINREVDGAKRSIEITATSTDEFGAIQTSRQIFVIAIADQNEFAASTVADVNSAADALTSAGVALHGLVAENATENTVVGITARATDTDASSVITYSLSDDANGRFQIGAASGVVTTTGKAIDREADDGATRSIEVTATSTDESGVTQTSKQRYVIAVTDQNEFAVSALMDSDVTADIAGTSSGAVAENADADTLVGITTSATDADASSVIRYSLSQNEGGFFKIDEKSGVVSTTSVQINRETHGATRTIEVTATSTDESGVIQTSQQSFIIQIDNVFETRPLVISNPPSSPRSFQENIETDSEAAVVARLQLLGGDSAPEGKVEWKMAEGNDTRFFTLTQDGTVRLNRADFEAAYANGDLSEGYETLDNQYTIKVQAQDQHGNLSQEVTLTVDVTDDDDEALPGDQSVVVREGVAAVPEFTGEGAAAPAVIGVATFVNAIGLARWALSGPDVAHFGFKEGKDTGLVRLTFTAPDHEAEKAKGRSDFVYKATLTGTDDDGNQVQKDISLTLENVNFNIVGMPAETISINENTATDSEQAVVARFSLTLDQPNDEVHWSLKGEDTDRFQLAYEAASQAWVLRLKQADYEGAWENGLLKAGAESNDNDYTVTVAADDGWGNAHEVSVRVRVADVEEHSSERRVDGFLNTSQSLKETTKPTLLGVPLFLNAQGEVTWGMSFQATLSDASFYKDDQGQLWFFAADYESPEGLVANPQRYAGTLSGTDEDNNTYKVDFEIQVMDRPLVINLAPSDEVVQAEPTVTQSDGSRVSTWRVMEHRADNTTRHAIGTVSLDALVSDDAYGSLVWTLDSGYGDHAFFELNPDGSLSLQAMDYETLPDSADGDKVYEVRLVATDTLDGTAIQTNTHVLKVEVQDDDAEPADFGVTGLEATYTRDENIALTDAGALLGTVSVAAGGVYNGEITWSLRGDDQDRFALDTQTGELRLKPQNYEELGTDNVHRVTVVGTDSDHNEQSTDVAVKVANIREEKSFELTINDIYWIDYFYDEKKYVQEDSWIEFQLGTIGDTPEGKLSESIWFTKLDGSLIDVEYHYDAQTMKLGFKSLDWEAWTKSGAAVEFNLFIIFTDQENNNSGLSWLELITRDALEPRTLQIVGLSDEVSWTENDEGFSVQPTLVSTQPDGTLSTIFPITWMLEEVVGHETDKDLFKLDEDGILTFKFGPFDYENKQDADGNNRYELMVKVVDADQNMVSQRVTVAIVNQLERGIDDEFSMSAVTDGDVRGDTTTGEPPGVTAVASGAVSENAVENTQVGITAKATGPEASSVITYSLTHNLGGFFQIDPVSGVVTTTKTPINREVDGATRTIEVTAKSADASGVTQISQQSFIIQIDNVFETRPLVISNPPSSPRSFQENIETDSEAAVVARLQLLGGDSAPEGKVEWKMAEGNDTRFFTLTQDGTVRLNRADFEAAYANGDLSEGYETLDNQYTIKVQAQDQHGNLSQEVTLTVDVTDDDDEALPGDQSVVVREGVAAVPEFTGEGSAAPAVIGVATFVNAIGLARWALSGPDVAHFGLKEGKDTGLVRLTFTAPDHEAEKAKGRSDFVYKATLTGTDDDGNQVQKDISLALENVNFNIVGMPAETISINENTATDNEQAVVARLSVGGDQHPVNWSMTGDDIDRFEWAYEDASKAWVLRLKQADYEGAWENGLPKPGAENNDNDYNVTLRADDGWGHAHEVSVRVLVADVEEHSSEQRVDGLVAMPQSVVESVQPTVLGTPRFFNALGPVTWDISPDATRSSSPFYKDEQGRLWFSATDYEDPQGLWADPQSYRAKLTGTDQDGNRFELGLDIRVSDRPLVINLAPSDEVTQAEATVTQSDGSRVSTWRVVEHRADNTTRHAIGTVSLDALVSDDAYGSLVWTLDSGYGDHAFFELNPDGSLSLQAMDYETLPDSADGDKVYEVRLVATDTLDGTAIQTNTHVLKVEVQDDDAEPADFGVTGLEATYTRDENIALTDAGALLGTVSVAAGGVYNGEITWSLRGDDQDRFALDTQTGELRLKPQNYEEFGTDNVHHVTVVGTDSDHNEQSTDVVVNLANVREPRSFDLTVNGEWWFDLFRGFSQAPYPIPIPAGQTVAIPLGVWGEAPEGLLLATERTHLSVDHEANFVDYTFNSQTNTLLFETVNHSGKDYILWGKLEDQDGNQTESFLVWFKTFISATAPILNNSTGQAATGTEDTEWVEITLADLIAAGDGHDPDEGDSIRTFFVEKVNTGRLKIGSTWETATDYAENNDVIGEVGTDIRNAFWTPAAHANGMLSAFQVRALDGDVFEVSSPPPDASFTLDVLVQVTPAPDAPVITSDTGSSLGITEPTTPISRLLNWSDPDEGGAVPSRITVEFTSGYRSDVDELSLDRQALNDFFQDFLFEKQPDEPLWELRLKDTSELDAFELSDAWTDVFRSILYTHTAAEVDTTPRELVFKAWDEAAPTLFGSYAMHLVL